MENPAIQAAVRAPVTLVTVKATLPAPKKQVPTWVKILTPIASLRITVVLFGLSFFLVFVGTLAQRDAGIWTVVSQYFRSLYVWVPLQIFNFSSEYDCAGGFPFARGWLLGVILLVNLR